jgi:hypothetical protein
VEAALAISVTKELTWDYSEHGIVKPGGSRAPSTDHRRHAKGIALMKHAAMVMAFVVLGHDFGHPAAAQSSVGGPKKQMVVGGAAKQSSPVVPLNKAAAMPANKGAAAIPLKKVAAAPGSAPPHLKCAAGSCVAKASR